MADEFKYHQLNAAGLAAMAEITEDFDWLLDNLALPLGRERSLAVTALQEACFWAKRAYAGLLEYQAEG